MFINISMGSTVDQIFNVLPHLLHRMRPCVVTFTPTKVWRQYGQVMVGTEGATAFPLIVTGSTSWSKKRVGRPADIRT